MSIRSRILKGLEFAVFIIIALLIKIAFFSGCGDEISDSKPRYEVAPTLEPYLVEFVEQAASNGVDLSYIYEQDITIKYVKGQNPKKRVGVSYGRDKDKIVVFIYKDRFINRTEQGRKYVMFHELGHDILNLPHGEHGMMRATAYSGFFQPHVDNDRQTKYLYASLNDMFERFKNN